MNRKRNPATTLYSLVALLVLCAVILMLTNPPANTVPPTTTPQPTLDETLQYLFNTLPTAVPLPTLTPIAPGEETAILVQSLLQLAIPDYEISVRIISNQAIISVMVDSPEHAQEALGNMLGALSIIAPQENISETALFIGTSTTTDIIATIKTADLILFRNGTITLLQLLNRITPQ